MVNFPMVWESEEANPFSLELFWSECLSTVIGKGIKTGCTLSRPYPKTLHFSSSSFFPLPLFPFYFFKLPSLLPLFLPFCHELSIFILSSAHRHLLHHSDRVKRRKAETSGIRLK